MTQKEILKRLLAFNHAETDVTRDLYLAMQYFDEGAEQHSWTLLFMWCLSKDKRAEAWGQVRDIYFDATHIKEGTKA
jgi:hypothetical protein